jgi:hypothetical protein
LGPFKYELNLGITILSFLSPFILWSSALLILSGIGSFFFLIPKTNSRGIMSDNINELLVFPVRAKAEGTGFSQGTPNDACPQCGVQLSRQDAFCGKCGASVQGLSQPHHPQPYQQQQMSPPPQAQSHQNVQGIPQQQQQQQVQMPPAQPQLGTSAPTDPHSYQRVPQSPDQGQNPYGHPFQGYGASTSSYQQPRASKAPKGTFRKKQKFLNVCLMIGAFIVASINLYYYISNPWLPSILLTVAFTSFGIYELIQIVQKIKQKQSNTTLVLVNGAEPVTKGTNIGKLFLAVAALMIPLTFILTLPTCGVGGFDIRGNWKVVGGVGWGQMQQSSAIVFKGGNCNVYSPNDTYVFYKENDTYKLDVTGLLGGNTSFDVKVNSSDDIELSTDDGVVRAVLKRMG